jgi:hypothetical protein
MLSELLQWRGTFVAVERPWPVGPRNSGQSVEAARVVRERRRMKRGARRMGRDCSGWEG